MRKERYRTSIKCSFLFPCYSSQKFPLYHTILSLFNYPYFSGLKKKKLRFRDVKRTGPVDTAESKSKCKSVNSSSPLAAQHPTLPFLECSHYLMQGPWVGPGTWESPRLVEGLSPASPLLSRSCLTSPGPRFITATIQAWAQLSGDHVWGARWLRASSANSY